MTSKVVFINGGTGFIGRALCSALLKRSSPVPLPKLGTEAAGNSEELNSSHINYQLYVQTRMPSHHRHKAIRFVSSYADLPAGTVPDIVVNLAGAPIADKRWSQSQKKVLRDSRVRLTESLFQALSAKGHTPEVLLNASAIGYYGVQQDQVLDETSPMGEGFAPELCSAWEAAAQKFSTLGTRVCVFRIGVVLGPGGGALGKLLPLFKMALGGPIGSGEQWFSWIHITDLVNLLLSAMDSSDYRGVINATSPNPVRQAEFAQAFGRQLNRPAILPTPSWVLRCVYGQMADELLIGGQRVEPKTALALGFSFKHEDIGSALADVTQV